MKQCGDLRNRRTNKYSSPFNDSSWVGWLLSAPQEHNVDNQPLS